jgi:predicted amidophosphoribosyltransferase
MAKAALQALGQIVVPPACAACGTPQSHGDAVCLGCRAQLVALPANRCARCGAPSGRDAPSCPECRGRRLAFTFAWAAFAYNAACQRLMAALKSRGRVAVAGFMGAEIAARAPAAVFAGATALVPGPAHPRRRLRDGFSPAAEVAAHVSTATGVPVVHLLRRCGRAPPQARLGREERLRMGPDAVGLRPGPVPGGRLVLVDDVYTTGATANACANALLAGGIDEVSILSFARAIRSSI